ncbi:MAG: HNH endonuclease [Longimicrobiales bacterium]|nr:HNH endonuclease [Longimicrobiales bacterium]
MGCLALNASYEPLTLVSTRRAVRLVLERKAEILETEGDRAYRSETMCVPAPTVIRLVRFIHVPRRLRRQVTNTFLFARDDYRCVYCGRHRGELRGRQFLTRDHVLPASRGGRNSWENVVTACSPCNNRKGDRLPEEAGMPLRVVPAEPNYVRLVWAVRRVTPIQARWIALFYGEDALALVAGRDRASDPDRLSGVRPAPSFSQSRSRSQAQSSSQA